MSHEERIRRLFGTPPPPPPTGPTTPPSLATILDHLRRHARRGVMPSAPPGLAYRIDPDGPHIVVEALLPPVADHGVGVTVLPDRVVIEVIPTEPSPAPTARLRAEIPLPNVVDPTATRHLMTANMLRLVLSRPDAARAHRTGVANN